ncbi:MAG: 3-hydroxybutyryl-CoA dehydrogenase [Thermoflexales bacterium]|nr:3-hydroxybutyryl-CoA dehydrogenase [Thermoflexales bacterium]
MNIQDIHTIGVAGCGLMGAGIVEICARAGFSVVVRELDDELAQKGVERLRRSTQKAVDRGKLSADEQAAMLGRVEATTDLGKLAACQLVVEAVVENLELKKQVFAELDRLCPPETVLATNTSSLNITSIAAATGRGDKVLGLHFFNPVPVMPLLEIVRALLTSDETVTLGRALGEKLGKTVVVAKDRPGFIANLLFVPYALDAIRWYDAGLASREDIDTTMKLGFNHPMGPLTLCDFVGLDTLLFIADAMYDEFKDARYAAPPLLRRLVAAGLLGRKSGRGFYEY